MGEQGQAKLAMEGVVHDLNNVFQTILQAAFLISADEAHAASADIIARGVAQCRRILGWKDPVNLRRCSRLWREPCRSYMTRWKCAADRR